MADGLESETNGVKSYRRVSSDTIFTYAQMLRAICRETDERAVPRLMITKLPWMLFFMMFFLLFVTEIIASFLKETKAADYFVTTVLRVTNGICF